jgi:predicted ribosome quality control (RQC) complex YloA/Tae2 family protein
LQIILSHSISKTSYIEKQEKPTNFAMAVRNRIEGFQIKSISQMNNDRIMVFCIAKGGTEINVIVEMFDNGNVIITDRSMNTLLVYRQRQQKGRIIKPNVEYKPPKQSENYTIEIPKIIRPVIFRDASGKAIDYSITENGKYNNLEKQYFNNLQEALDMFYYENPVGAKEEKESELAQQLKSSIEKQMKILSDIDKEISENRQIGDKVFNNMNRINGIIEELRKNKRITKAEIQSISKDINIIDLDLKNKTVTIEID